MQPEAFSFAMDAYVFSYENIDRFSLQCREQLMVDPVVMFFLGRPKYLLNARCRGWIGQRGILAKQGFAKRPPLRISVAPNISDLCWMNEQREARAIRFLRQRNHIRGQGDSHRLGQSAQAG